MSQFLLAAPLILLAEAGTSDVRFDTAMVVETAKADHRTTQSKIPLGTLLLDRARGRELSFVFKTSLVEGKFASPPRQRYNDGLWLSEVLGPFGLTHQKIGDRTFVITDDAGDNVAVTGDMPTQSPSPAPVEIDRILIVASAGKAYSIESSHTIFDLNAASIEALAVNRTSKIIHELPQSVASISSGNSVFLGDAAGLNFADLYGLGVGRTLVLVNGARRTLTPGGNDAIAGVDLDMIAPAFIDRIEIQNQAGGARFGPEAVAGVVNIVTRRDSEGVEIGGDIRLSQLGEARESQIYGFAGKTLGTVQISFGVDHTSFSGLIGRDRDITTSPYGFAANGRRVPALFGVWEPGFGGNPITPNGAIIGAVNANGALIDTDRFYVLNEATEVEPFQGRVDQLFNWLPDTSTLVPFGRTRGLAHVDFTVGDRLQVFADANISQMSFSVQRSAAVLSNVVGADRFFGDAARVNFSEESIPPSVREFSLEQFGNDISDIYFAGVVEGLGPRERRIGRLNAEMLVGAETPIGAGFGAAVSYRYGANRARTRQLNLVDRDRLSEALDLDRCALNETCTPINLFSSEIPLDAYNFIRAPALARHFSIAEHEVSAELRSEPERNTRDDHARIGISIRSSSIKDRDISSDAAAIAGAPTNADYNGRLNAVDLFAAIDHALFRNESAIDAIRISSAFRASFSSQRSTSLNAGITVNFQLSPAFSLFGGYSIGERPPNLLELFFVGAIGDRRFDDPCAPIGDAPAERYAANCSGDTALSVADGFVQTNLITEEITLGNANLDNESYRNFHAGFAYSGQFGVDGQFGDAFLSAQWNSYVIDNVIGSISNPLDYCFSAEDLTETACLQNPIANGPLIQRDPLSEQIIFVGSVLENRGSLAWRGLNLELRTSLEPNHPLLPERMWFSGAHTLIEHVALTDGMGEKTKLVGLIDYPRHRTRIGAGIDIGPAAVSISASRRGRTVTTRQDIDSVSLPPYTRFDFTIHGKLRRDIWAKFAIENLTNRNAPLAAFADGPNTAPQYYDIIGRRFSLALRKTF